MYLGLFPLICQVSLQAGNFQTLMRARKRFHLTRIKQVLIWREKRSWQKIFLMNLLEKKCNARLEMCKIKCCEPNLITSTYCAAINDLPPTSKCFTCVTKTIANLTTYSRKPGDYSGTIIFEIDIMKNSSPLNLKFPFFPLSKPQCHFFSAGLTALSA